MPRVNLSSKDVERVLRRNGFQLASQKGSHQQFRGILEGKKRRVTVLANKKDFDIKTFKSMVRQSGLGEEKFFK
jgi:predicted RNA binding protein YcfA (HicA-like mRNA interferase family)